MIRHILVLMPVFAVVVAIALDSFLVNLRRSSLFAKLIGGILFVGLLGFHANHAVYFSFNALAENYVNYEIETPLGIQRSDDHREAFRWLFENAAPDARVLAFWDAGYQLSAFSQRAVYIDGHTNNFTHMGLVGLFAASPEAAAWQIARMLDADYYAVVFGGAIGFQGDDIGKAPWLFPAAARHFANLSTEGFQNEETPFFVAPTMPAAAQRSMLFRAAYHRFGALRAFTNVTRGTDIARGTAVGGLAFELRQFTEAYTTAHWLLRIYAVRPDPQWDRAACAGTRSSAAEH
jgi:dolichyl-diphosphooligosaccharide--protein glycosyltransferase